MTAVATKPIFRSPAPAPLRPTISAPSIPLAQQPSPWQPVPASTASSVAMPTDRLPWEKPYEPQPSFRFLVLNICVMLFGEITDHRSTSESFIHFFIFLHLHYFLHNFLSFVSIVCAVCSHCVPFVLFFYRSFTTGLYLLCHTFFLSLYNISPLSQFDRIDTFIWEFFGILQFQTKQGQTIYWVWQDNLIHKYTPG